MCLNHFPICLKLKQHCKSLIPRLKKVKLVIIHKEVYSRHPSPSAAALAGPCPALPFNNAEYLPSPFLPFICLSRDLVYLISFFTGPTMLFIFPRCSISEGFR